MRVGHVTPIRMRTSTLKSLSAAALLAALLALSACNRGYGCPNALEADVEQPTRVR